eukprot:CAMPEP_0113889416 /NCGR_PEP_ID=MMETSP0780_2-20120614/13477_1 /TAXON_ID=652834 /ORGANISM="Palpitomonas bilix" /LENGTH=156 /DNA_ID=CAMNT_0000878497 /DNA_START=185 /DNA_END=655 /DNA_ORIENTATION=+ /assembly_acc=CAM_ASM_000599
MTPIDISDSAGREGANGAPGRRPDAVDDTHAEGMDGIVGVITYIWGGLRHRPYHKPCFRAQFGFPALTEKERGRRGEGDGSYHASAYYPSASRQAEAEVGDRGEMGAGMGWTINGKAVVLGMMYYLRVRYFEKNGRGAFSVGSDFHSLPDDSGPTI